MSLKVPKKNIPSYLLEFKEPQVEKKEMKVFEIDKKSESDELTWMEIDEVLTQERCVFLFSELDKTNLDDYISLLLLLSEDEDDIYVYINSESKDMRCGITFYDTMHSVSPRVWTVAVGLAASISSFILSGGTYKKRVGFPHCRVRMQEAEYHSFRKSKDDKSKDDKSKDGKSKDGKSKDGKSKDGKSEDHRSYEDRRFDEDLRSNDRRKDRRKDRRNRRSADRRKHKSLDLKRYKSAEFLAVETEENLELTYKMIEIFAKNTKKPISVIQEDFERGKCMSVTEAMKYGVIDKQTVSAKERFFSFLRRG